MRRIALLIVPLLLLVALWLSRGTEDAQPVQREGEPVAVAEPPATPSSGPTRPETPRERRHASDAETVAPPAAEKATPTRRFGVRVLGPGDVPLPGAAFFLQGDRQNTPHVTDGAGETWVDVDAGLAEVFVTTPLQGLGKPVRLAEEMTVLRYADLLPLTIEFVDMETGLPLPVRPHEDVVVRGVAGAPRDRVYVERAPLRPGTDAGLLIAFDALEGYVHPGENAVRRQTHVSRFTDRVTATIPVPRELLLRVRVFRHDGEPAVGAAVSGSVSGAPHRASSRTGSDGETTLRDLPFLRGERVTTLASDAEGRRSAAMAELDDSGTETVLDITLPESTDEAIGLGGGAGGAFSSRSGRRTLTMGSGRVNATVFRRNGLPAAGARVLLSGPLGRSARADENGEVRFTHLPPGEYTLTLREPGLTATSTELQLATGETAVLSLTEQPGRDGLITVTDGDGRPVPHARITATLPWGDAHVQIANGEQRLDLWTDLYGRCRLTDLPAAPVAVTARFGSRNASGSLKADTLELQFTR